MKNKQRWFVLVLILLISAIIYLNLGAEARASILFFGALILICLLGGLLVALFIKSFFKNL